MKRLLFVLVLCTLVLANCGKSEKPAPLQQKDTPVVAELYMIPSCIHCKKSWQSAGRTLSAKTVQVDSYFVGRKKLIDRQVASLLQWAKENKQEQVMIDSWFANQNLAQTAKDLGLSPKQLQSILTSPKYKIAAQKGFKKAQRLRVKQVPTLFLSAQNTFVITGEFTNREVQNALQRVGK